MKRRTFMAAMAASGFGQMASGYSKQDRFFVPPEEALHELTFMQWPVSRRVYGAGSFLTDTQDTIAELANTISEFEPVIMLAAKTDHPAARRKLSARVDLWDIPTEDLWARDSGPIFVKNQAGERAVRHIRFNGWGGRQVHKNDGQIAQRVAQELGLALLPTGLKGEAGGVEQDGHGTLIAHESSWVHENRNPGMTRSDIGDALLAAYGADRIIWSKGLKNMDITDYHIDALARFTGPGRALICLPDDPNMSDPFQRAALETYDVLVGAGLEIQVIPEPVKRRVKSDEFVASYANYYVCNGAVIAQQYGDRKTDEIAQSALSRHYKGREIIMMNADIIGEIGGGIHCATHEMPL